MDPSDKKAWGKHAWCNLEEDMEAIPCSGCREKGIVWIHGLRDVVNLETGRKAYRPRELLELQKDVNQAVSRMGCRGGSCNH